MKPINIPLNIPNFLSLFRLFSFPFVMIFILIDHQKLFVFFICFNLLTDFLDGWIARKYNQITEIGSVIDSLADTGTYFLAIGGIIAFKWADFQPYLTSVSVFIGLLVIADLLPLIKFGKFNSYHTLGAKIGAYLKGLFFIVLFTAGFFEWFYYVAIISGMIIFLENILITLILKEPRSDVRGLYWLMNDSKHRI